jgi:L-threonylcarbamoyladenylate synthase
MGLGLQDFALPESPPIHFGDDADSVGVRGKFNRLIGIVLMDTEILSVDQAAPDAVEILRAAELLRAGRLVAFPTETVYGLGANALDPRAIQLIYDAKGRPGNNPLIVHVVDAVQVLNVVREWPKTAELLAERFWPGPLTLVLPKRPEVPDSATAGGPTVAVRCPAHPVAQALLRAAGIPVAAPSANRSTELSPTRAQHVLASLGGRIELILDAGPCPGGIESTVIDVTRSEIRLLRPGLIPVTQLEEIVGPVLTGGKPGGHVRSPGQMAKHYSPRTGLRLAPPGHLMREAEEGLRTGLRVGIVTFGGHGERRKSDGVVHKELGDDPRSAAENLYDTLHQLDGLGLDVILVESPPDTADWAAIRDRLTRAAYVS